MEDVAEGLAEQAKLARAERMHRQQNRYSLEARSTNHSHGNDANKSLVESFQRPSDTLHRTTQEE